MASQVVKVINAEGIHMRPAGLIAKAVKAHPESEVIMKANGTDVEIVVNGGDEHAVLGELVKMFEEGFGE